MGKSSPQVLCQFGINFMLEQTQRLVDELPGVQLGRDIEAIHRMRVASRRLATGLEVFKPCLPKKKSKLWRDEIRKVTYALGNARNLDIQIAQLTELYGEKLEATNKPGYNRLLLRLKQSRSKAQKKVNKTAFKLKESQALEEMVLWFEKHREAEPLPESYPPSLLPKAYRAITAALEDFLMHSDFIASEADSDKLHAMRIAGKRLRYTMEIFAPLYGGDLEPFIVAMKEIQDTLGEFHDADVWISWLPKFVDKEKARIEDYFGNTGPLERLMPGIHHLMAYNEQIRSDAYQSFLMTWQTLADDNAWQILCELLTPPPLPLKEELEDVDILDTTDELPDWIEEEDDGEDTEEIVNFTDLTEEVFAVEEPEGTPQPNQGTPLSAEDSDEDKFIDLTDTFPTEG
ncbi:MAG: CHAD domain-containing protein [Anaerolineaceae bacterium]|nr:CHAD domain-containing protein [Anaerolineaceae bacterium]